MRRLEVGFLVGDDFEESAAQAEDLLGGVPQGLDLFFVFRGRVGGRAVEDARLDRVVADAGVLEDPLQHEPVEGDLEAVFDLDLDGGLHVADEDVQGAERGFRQAQEVHVATQQPAGDFGLQAGLEQQDGLAGRQLAGFLDDLVVVLRAVVGLAVLDRRS